MTDSSSSDRAESLEQIGLDNQGVKKSSRIIPLLIFIAIVVMFIAYEVKVTLPDIKLTDVQDVNDIQSEGKNLFVVAKTKESGKEEYHFRIFDSKGNQRIDEKKRQETDIIETAGENVQERLENLKTELNTVWGKEISDKDKDSILTGISMVTDYRPDAGEFIWYAISSVTNIIEADFLLIFKAQLKTISILLLYAFIPGVLGMIFRRAFWTWFLVSFVIFYAIQWGFVTSGAGSLTPELREELSQAWTEPVFLYIEVALILLLLAFRLRRHSAAAISRHTKRNSVILGLVLIGVAIAWVMVVDISTLSWWQLAVVVMLLMIGLTIVWQTFTTLNDNRRSHKNIVVCLDGTWNEPGTKDFGYLAETNVFKLFKMLKGEKPDKYYNANQCKQYLDKDGFSRQIAFYYHGVGNKVENSELGQLFGGAFGMGASAIVERAYIDIARVYQPGDRIFIFGFSRGAAIARILAGAIGLRDIPKSFWTLRFLGRHFMVWKSSVKITASLDGAEKGDSAGQHAESSKEVRVEVLGCWDTVGAFGIAKNIAGIPFQKINLLKDLSVSLCVKRAYHMVALDETRDSFVPTLMEPDPIAPDRIVEVWFSGNHSNIGGGYATDKLSNITLDFLLKHISSGYAWSTGMEPGDESWGLYLNAMKKDDQRMRAPKENVTIIDPDPRGRIRQASGAAYSYAPRVLPIHAVIHDDVFTRMREAVPVYAPQSLFNLNSELARKRKDIEMEVARLVETNSLGNEESERIRNWSSKKLSLMKWSQYMELYLFDDSQLKAKIKPATELSNDIVRGPNKSIKNEEIDFSAPDLKLNER